MDWTDDRLQERFNSIDRRFDEVDKRFEQVDKRFEQVDKRFEQVDRRFDRVDRDIHCLRDEMNTRFDTVQRTMMQGSIGVIVGLIGLIATQL